jgi:branched-subunit amino acid aminotransferase/4-amino-4-deoxychorismate lyase
MPAANYICLDGEFLRNHEPVLHASNRGFRFNDALTESIHANATDPQFLDLHIERLIDNMRALSMYVPPFFSETNFEKLITGLLNKNRIFGGAHIRLTVFRNSGESYIPVGNEVSFLIDCAPLNTDRYELNEKGLSIGISKNFLRNTGSLANLHRANITVFIRAAMEGRESGHDAVILLNKEGRLTETTDSNLFLVSGNSIFTPGLDQGCIPGVMRRVIIECAIKSGYRVNEQSSLTPSALLDAGEIFLTNAIEGIRWVGGYRENRYFSKTSRLLSGLLNSMAFGQ